MWTRTQDREQMICVVVMLCAAVKRYASITRKTKDFCFLFHTQNIFIHMRQDNNKSNKMISDMIKNAEKKILNLKEMLLVCAFSAAAAAAATGSFYMLVPFNNGALEQYNVYSDVLAPWVGFSCSRSLLK